MSKKTKKKEPQSENQVAKHFAEILAKEYILSCPYCKTRNDEQLKNCRNCGGSLRSSYEEK